MLFCSIWEATSSFSLKSHELDKISLKAQYSIARKLIPVLLVLLYASNEAYKLMVILTHTHYQQVHDMEMKWNRKTI